MSKFVAHSMTPQTVLDLAANLLQRHFLEARRLAAKRLFAELGDRQSRYWLRLSMPDGSELAVWLQLDTSEYRGRLNFGGFKAQLALLLERIRQRLEAGADANVYASESGAEQVFNIPAVMIDKDRVNVMVLGLGAALPGRLSLKLLFLDPSQFAVPAAAEGASNDGSSRG